MRYEEEESEAEGSESEESASDDNPHTGCDRINPYPPLHSVSCGTLQGV